MKTTEIVDALKRSDITVPEKISKSVLKKTLEKVSTYKLFRFLTELEIDGFCAKEHITDDRDELIDFFIDKFIIDEESSNDEKGIKKFLGKVKNADSNSYYEFRSKKKHLKERQNGPESFEEAVEKYNNEYQGKIEYLSKYKGYSSLYNISSENNIYFTAQNTAVDITQTDNIWFKFCSEINTDFFIIAENNNGEAGKQLALGSFLKNEEHDGQYFLEIESNNNKITFPNSIRSYFLVFSDVTITRIYAVEITMKSNELPTDDTNYLCIDFGTSNTTAGTWKDDNGKKIIELVKFDDVTRKDKKTSYLYPSIAYVKHAEFDPSGNIKNDKNSLEMLFGYEAKKRLIDEDYNPAGSIFFNIKQWISADENDTVECKGENIGHGTLRVRDIMEKYLRKVVDYSEMKLKRHFTKLHFTAPVKLKAIFNDIVTNIFKEYKVLSVDESLDEATAVMYKTISRWRDIKTAKNEGKVFVIDCGGGTTDVALCEYKFEDTPAGKKTTISTKFENGQNNFGGNDITYRIFQLLKIKLCNYYQEKDEKTVDELIGAEEDYLTVIDNCIENNFVFSYYKNFDKESADAEWIIPTDFANKNIVNGDSIEKPARRNFNYLWQWAEKIKIEFFTNQKIAEYRFSDKKIKLDDKDIPFSLYVDRSGTKDAKKTELKPLTEVPNIGINNNELKSLLSPQIYYILSLMLIGADRKELPIGKDKCRLKLTGQSCNISLFDELLKEFISGKELRTANSGNEKNVEALKLACIEGSIGYLMERDYGAAETTIITETPSILYKVTTDTGDRKTKEETLFNGAELSCKNSKIVSNYGFVCRPITSEKIRYNTYNNIIGGNEPEKSGVIDRKVNNSSRQYSIEDLKKEILRTAVTDFDKYIIHQDNKESSKLSVIDFIGNRIEQASPNSGVFYFAVPNKDGCGFVLWQVLINEENSKTYFCAEHTTVFYQGVNDCKSYFDGKNCVIDKEDP